jgi:hypothetical protein
VSIEDSLRDLILEETKNVQELLRWPKAVVRLF